MPRWVWASTSPGRTVRPERSITRAPAGTAGLPPTAVIFSPSTTIVWLRATVPFSGSTRRPARTTVVSASAAGGRRRAKARARRREGMGGASGLGGLLGQLSDEADGLSLGDGRRRHHVEDLAREGRPHLAEDRAERVAD